MARIDLDATDSRNHGLDFLQVFGLRQLPEPNFQEGTRVQTPHGPGTIMGMEGSRLWSHRGESWRYSVLVDAPKLSFNPAYFWSDEVQTLEA